MDCKDIMHSNLIWATKSDSCQSAAKLMADNDVGFLPICDPNTSEPLGTLTDRDLCIRLVAFDKSASSTLINDVMTHEVVSCNQDDDVDEAREALADNQVSRLLVCDDDGKLVGVISLSDLPQVAPEIAEETFEAIKQPQAPMH